MCEFIITGRNEVAERQCFQKRVSRILSRGGVSASVHAGIHPPGRHPPGQTSPWADTPPRQQTATAADVTHPTGMHSC